MKINHPSLLWSLLLLSCWWLISCQTSLIADSPPTGRLLLWHSWPESETQALDELLTKFTTISGIKVLHNRVSIDQLQGQFKRRAEWGLAPDILIGPSDWLRPLAEAKLIQDLSARPDLNLNSYRSTALETLYYQDKLYGLPLALHTMALYYNTQQVNQPADTLQVWLAQATEGQKIALNTNFEAAFWGVPAFGGQLFDENRQRVVLDRGGFANWLGWLKIAQDEPNIILDNDTEWLHNLFKQGEVAYYVGSSTELPGLQQALGEDTVGVTPLPAGPLGPASPFMRAEAMMFNTSMSAEQTELALRLAQFLTTAEQQRKLARNAYKIPANPQARVDPRVYPALAGFVAQTQTAMPRLNRPEMARLTEYGTEAYIEALTGVKGLQETANQLTARVNGEAVTPSDSTVQCPTDLGGSVRLWHSWSEPAANTLNQIRWNFMRLCPGIFIGLTPFLDSNDLVERYQEVVPQDRGPDLLLGSSRWLKQLVSQPDSPVLQDLTPMIEPIRQRYVRAAQESMRYNDKWYGVPVSMELMALYYRPDLVSDPALDIEELRRQASVAEPVGLPIDFYHAFWGLRAFGGIEISAATDYRPILNAAGFISWLDWLKQAQDTPGIILSSDLEELAGQFAAGELAYLVGSSTALGRFQQALGADLVRVTPLPSGPRGNTGAPFITTQGLMLTVNKSQTQQHLTFEFVKYMTDVDSQQLLMTQANQLPANINVKVDPITYPAIAGFMEQANVALPLPVSEQTLILGPIGEAVYNNVLNDTLSPAEAVQGLLASFDETTLPSQLRLSPTPTVNQQSTPATTPASDSICPESGPLRVWHSWSAQAATAFNQLVTNFERRCPGIDLTVEFVAPEALTNRLALVSQTDSSPDLFLAAYHDLDSWVEDKLVKPITSLANQPVLEVQFLPQSVTAMQLDQQLYGLPQTIQVTALYYNPDLASTPPTTLVELLNQTSPETPTGLDTSFTGAFWGIAAVGQPLLTVDNQLITITQTGLVEWLSWLDTAQNQPGFNLSPNPATLHQQFAQGDLAYLMADSASFNGLQTALSPAQVGVSLLPSGPAGQAQPLLSVEGFFFTASAMPTQTNRAIKFAEFATSTSSQRQLMEEANILPANLAVDTTAHPAIASFVRQAQNSFIWPAQFSPELLETGNTMYRQLLTDQLEPTEAVEKWVAEWPADETSHPNGK